MKRRLFAHEREIRSWRSVTLTTHRVIHLEASHGFDGSTSIPLEHLQWTRLTRSHKPIHAIFAGLLAAFGLFAMGQKAEAICIAALLLALVFLLAYLGSRRATMMLASGGGRIELPIDASSSERQKARDFLDTIEDAAGHASRRGHVSAAA